MWLMAGIYLTLPCQALTQALPMLCPTQVSQQIVRAVPQKEDSTLHPSTSYAEMKYPRFPSLLLSGANTF